MCSVGIVGRIVGLGECGTVVVLRVSSCFAVYVDGKGVLNF